MGVTHKLSIEEYLALPEEKPYLEYICGEAVPKAIPDRNHIALVFELSHLLYEYIRSHGGFGGPEGRSQFDDTADPRFLLPDLSYWGPGRETGDHILTPPTLAIEVRSDDQTRRSLRDKCRYYRAHGVDVAWLVDPVSRTVEVFDGTVDGPSLPPGGILESPQLPGLSITVAELWRAIDR
jgi:Uma2 family endonuclease